MRDHVFSPAFDYPPLSDAANPPPDRQPPLPSLTHPYVFDPATPPPGPPDTPPAPFEALRQYLMEAVEQLLTEMADQQTRYLIPAGKPLQLLERVASIAHRSPWGVWEEWALRHALPVHDLIQETPHRPLTSADQAILKARLRDLLGYALLGLVLAERDTPVT